MEEANLTGDGEVGFRHFRIQVSAKEEKEQLRKKIALLGKGLVEYAKKSVQIYASDKFDNTVNYGIFEPYRDTYHISKDFNLIIIS